MPDSLSSEEKFEQLVVKIYPHLQNLWKAKWKLLIFNIVVMILSVIILKFCVKNYYESTVTILPEYGSKTSMLGQYSDLAAMAGIKVGDSSPTEIYKNLMTSESVLSSVIYKKYYTEKFKDSSDLICIFEIKPDKDLKGWQLKRQLFLDTYNKILKEFLVADVERSTKILTLKIKVPESKLSADIANGIVLSLEDYVKNRRKSYAKDQLFYIQKRIHQVKDSLTCLEDKLEKFKDYNRITEESPELMLEQSRLLRAVEILNTVYVELNKQLEIAKIDEIKDTPILNIREFAKDPVIKAGPGRAVSFVIIMIFSIFLSCTYFLLRKQIFLYFNIIRTIKIN